jgi:ABC-type bacteriocin/lantibiotic exporter with double-glycine peptidase domain
VGEGEALRLTKASFAWDPAAEPVLQELEVVVGRGELVAVVGRVGAGKSSLLGAILGELGLVGGGLARGYSTVAYAAQQPWIQSLTVKENILCGRPEDRVRYNAVLEACALHTDLATLPAGDSTELGEQGVNLSGGQKQRVALARAAYAGADMVLLDDPLSAVDAQVGQHLFHRLLGPRGLLAPATRILVTHNTAFLGLVDRVLLLEGGRLVLSGPYEEIKDREEFRRYCSQEPGPAAGAGGVEGGGRGEVAGRAGPGAAEEARQEGRVGLANYAHYIRTLGPGLFLAIGGSS